jgi:peptidoglycan/xylan/chitin deacetylase (PgdA/CDA1 family)
MIYWDAITERLPREPIRWPNGARIAVLSLFDYQAEVGEWAFPDGTPNYGQITEASYGGRVGIWRLLDICDKHGIKATFNTCGITAERYPESVRAIVERGHEIAGHTYTHRPQFQLPYEEELQEVRKTVAAIERITGARIRGWRCPIVQPSRNTLKILVDEGFLWDGDFLNYDLPYMLDIGDKTLVEIPYTFSTDDFPFIYGAVRQDFGGFPGPRQTPAALFQLCKDEFDVLYAESAKTPKMFAFQQHPLIMGRAHRSLYYDRLLQHIKSHEGVWFATCSEVARYWLAHYNEKQEQRVDEVAGQPIDASGRQRAA